MARNGRPHRAPALELVQERAARIGPRLRELRNAADLGLVRLAREIQSDPSSISAWESGRAVPIARLAQLAKALNVPLVQLLGELA